MIRVRRSYIFGILGTSSIGLGLYLTNKTKIRNLSFERVETDNESWIRSLGDSFKSSLLVHASLNISEKYEYGKDTVYMTCKDILSENDLQERKMKEMAEKYEMIASQVFFRHGARTPLHRELPVGEPGYDSKILLQPVPHTEVPFFIRSLDGGPRPISNIEKRYESVKFEGGTHAGQLTNIGREQGFCLGLRLKRKYMNIWKILPENFNAEHVYLRSTNINRSIDTLQCVVAGMWGKHLERPMEFLVAKPNDEFLYPASHRCKSLKGIEVLAEMKFDEIEGYAEMNNLLKEKLKLEKAPWFLSYYDNVKCKKAHGKPIFDWLESMMGKLDEMTSKVFVKLRLGSQEFDDINIKLNIGKVFDVILNNFEKQDKKLFLYSAHDSTLVPLLLGFNAFNMKWPPFAADVSFDLLRDKETGNKLVSLSYCGRMIKIMPYEEFTDTVNRCKATTEEHHTLCTDESLHKILHDAINMERKRRNIEQCLSNEEFQYKREICQKKRNEAKKKFDAEEELIKSMGLPSIPCLRAEGCGVPKL